MHLCICFIASTYNIYQHIICIQDIFNILARSCYYFGQYWILNIDTGLIRLIRASKGWRLGKYQTWSPSCRIYIFVFFIFDCLIFSIAFWYLKVMKISKIYHQMGYLEMSRVNMFQKQSIIELCLRFVESTMWITCKTQCELFVGLFLIWMIESALWHTLYIYINYMIQDAPEVMWVTEWVTPLCLILLMWQTRQGPHLTFQVGCGTWLM